MFYKRRNSKKYKEILLNTKSHIWSGDCHNYILLINGNLDLVVEEGLALYDIIPLVPILETQGIKITDWQGSELSLASNKEGSILFWRLITKIFMNQRYQF